MNSLTMGMIVVATFLATVIAMPRFIEFMRKKQLGQVTREEGPLWHEAKTGTPTMGGAVFLVMILLGMLIFGIATGYFTIKLINGIFIFLFFGLIGFIDDFIKVFKKQNEGLTSKQKFLAQLFGSAVFVFLFVQSGQQPMITVPFIGSVTSIVLFTIFTMFWITGFSNAVNLTDGLDGLAATTSIIAYAFYAYLAFKAGQMEVLIICLSVVGALLGFLVYNRKPAQIFMGDVGSLALGAGLAIVSLLLHHEWSLLGVGIVFVCETASVMLQVASFKTTGKRIFKMSPIHHHFEMCGWSEEKVVTIFSLVGVLGAIMTMILM